MTEVSQDSGSESWAHGGLSGAELPRVPGVAGRGVCGHPAPGASRLAPLLLDFKLELHLPLVGVVGVVEGHVLRQDLAHDDDLPVHGGVEELRGHQRVAVVGLRRMCVRTGEGGRALGRVLSRRPRAARDPLLRNEETWPGGRGAGADQ